MAMPRVDHDSGQRGEADDGERRAVRLVLGAVEPPGEDRHQQQPTAHAEEPATEPGESASEERLDSVPAAHRAFQLGCGVLGAEVFWTSRTTSAKRVAGVGAPSTTAIMSRLWVCTQVARQ